MTPLTLVFDLDGTLAETAPDLIDALNFVLAKDGIAPVPLQAARALLGAGGRALIRRGYERAARPLTEQRLDTLFIDFLEFYNAHIADKSRLFPGVETCLERSGEAFVVGEPHDMIDPEAASDFDRSVA